MEPEVLVSVINYMYMYVCTCMFKNKSQLYA